MIRNIKTAFHSLLQLVNSPDCLPRKRTLHRHHFLFKTFLFLGIIALDRLGITTAGLGVGVVGDLVLISTLVHVTKTLPPGVAEPTPAEGEESGTPAQAAVAGPTGLPSSEQQQPQQLQPQTEAPQQTASSGTDTAVEATATAASQSFTSHSTFSTTTTAALSGTAAATTTTPALQGSESSETLHLHKLPTSATIAISCSAIAVIAIIAITTMCFLRRRRSRSADMKRRRAVPPCDISTLVSNYGPEDALTRPYQNIPPRPSSPSPESKQVRSVPDQDRSSDITGRGFGEVPPGRSRLSRQQRPVEMPKNLKGVMTSMESGGTSGKPSNPFFNDAETDERIFEDFNNGIRHKHVSYGLSSVYSRRESERYSTFTNTFQGVVPRHSVKVVDPKIPIPPARHAEGARHAVGDNFF